MTIAISAAACMGFAGCDEVDGDHRFIELPPVEAKRVVLLEEFTGQDCVNCPTAHATIKLLLEQYPENLVAVSIHAGPQSYPEDDFPGVFLATNDGEYYAKMHGITAYPTGVVNRTSGVQVHSDWGATIYDALSRPSYVELSLSSKLNEDGTAIEVTADIEAHEKLNGNLQLWVVENGILSLQAMPDSSIEWEYEHNHVFRGAINGQSGEPISLAVGETKSVVASVPLKDFWVLENIEIVGFIYNGKGVQQAAKCHIVNDMEDM